MRYIQRNPTKGIERCFSKSIISFASSMSVTFKEIPQRELRAVIPLSEETRAAKHASYIQRNPTKGIESEPPAETSRKVE